MHDNLITAPSGVPKNFAAELNQRSIKFSWLPPLTSERNGNIISYTLICNSTLSKGLSIVYQTEGTYVVDGLRPFTHYNCSIFATNKAGDGPRSSLIMTTLNDSKNGLIDTRITIY